MKKIHPLLSTTTNKNEFDISSILGVMRYAIFEMQSYSHLACQDKSIIDIQKIYLLIDSAIRLSKIVLFYLFIFFSNDTNTRRSCTKKGRTSEVRGGPVYLGNKRDLGIGYSSKKHCLRTECIETMIREMKPNSIAT